MLGDLLPLLEPEPIFKGHALKRPVQVAMVKLKVDFLYNFAELFDVRVALKQSV